jgi:hypothetical protein
MNLGGVEFLMGLWSKVGIRHLSEFNVHSSAVTVSAMASWHTGYLAGQEAQQLFRDIANQFHLSPEQLADIAQDFISEMQAGLKEYKRPMAMM